MNQTQKKSISMQIPTPKTTDTKTRSEETPTTEPGNAETNIIFATVMDAGKSLLKPNRLFYCHTQRKNVFLL